MNPWTAIVGRGKARRREIAADVFQALRERGLRVGGFVHRPIRDEEGEKVGYDVIDLASGASVHLAHRSRDPDICEWGFHHEAFERARAWATGGALDVVVVEVGVVEARKKGHWPTIEAVLDGPPAVVLMCIRPRALTEVALRLPDPAAGLELPGGPDDVATFIEDVTEIVRGFDR